MEEDDYTIRGACLEIWRQEPLDKTFRNLLLEYAEYLDKICVSFTLRFQEPVIETEEEESQVIKAIGYRPKEEIIVCGFFDPIFYATEEILRNFGGYLRAGAPEDVIPKIKGKAYKIWFENEDLEPEDGLDYYYLLDVDFVANYFNVRRDPAVLRRYSLDEYKIDGIKLMNLLQWNSYN